MTELHDLLEVQDLDTRLDQLRHRHDALPERAAVTAAAADVARAEEQLAQLQKERDAVASTQKDLEAEVSTIEAKRAHASGQLYGGSITAHKDLEALQHEIGTLEAMQAAVEDRILEQMELAEPLDGQIAALEPSIAAARATLETAEAALAASAGDLVGQISEADAERAMLADKVSPDLLKLYGALRGRLGGVGAARLDGARCLGCHLEIPAGELTEVRRAPEDAVVHCPECGRILIR